MESDQNRDNDKEPIIDCEGTCKTPVGCTCGNMEDAKDEVPEVLEVQVAQAQPEQVEEAPKIVVTVAGKTESESKEKSCQTPTCCKTTTGSCCKNNTCCPGRNKLEVYDWLRDIPQAQLDTQMVEVQFKNTRKSYYLNSNNLELHVGDMVAVEATPGHDIGEVTLTGKLVQLQMKKTNFRSEVKRVYRLAKPHDLDKWREARAKEHKTMLRAREIAENLKLEMKISDVEFQGDGNKAIFYYIADGRVDFRQLIKDYAAEFRIKIEMKQIGARQEAGRVGGIGPCGRELCCSSSMSNFVSVSTSAARLQDIPLNPQKLAGQCGKLKCCLNFEVDVYVEAQRKLPARDMILETKDNNYYHFKTDVLSGMMTYSTDKHFGANLVTISKDRVFEISRMNKNGKKPLHLATDEEKEQQKPVSYDLLANENIDRFDNLNDQKSKRKKKRRNKGPKEGNEVNAEAQNGRQPAGQHQRNNNRENNRPAAENNNNQGNNNNNERRSRNNNNRRRKGNNNRPPRDNNGKPDNQQSEG
ncbi:regulatory iron-sulfur-containing complex subunit RicT [Dysgonomonas sp. 25]|uniref:PSP1 domain-containing protein n=1 Tax=Dysgonomonas sp. 25 TaxID=2302933 RepID=UPI0013D7D07D|nr:regulatory iron-sulfur-containing complex subunit RicT [Dysgonomonas sp. 25]NDV68770.1 hypothetical protein [Dysgonomonas sp. 25]